MPRTYSELYIAVRNRLREAGIEAAELEGKLITATAAGKTTEKLLRDMRFYATDEVEKRAESMLKRRLGRRARGLYNGSLGIPGPADGGLARGAHTESGHGGPG